LPVNDGTFGPLTWRFTGLMSGPLVEIHPYLLLSVVCGHRRNQFHDV
jgi:hypothetical protein